jgi:mycothiol synthase
LDDIRETDRVGAHRIETLDELSPAQREAVLELVARATTSDAATPISEHVLMRLKLGQDVGSRHVLLYAADLLVGYSHLEAGSTGWIAEVALTGPGYAGPLVDAIVEQGGDAVQIWGRGETSLLATVLPGLGFHPVRVLVQMHRSLDLPLPEPVWPADVTVRTFEVGRDEDAWLAVNNAAFIDHPDQSNWTRNDIDEREREPWFDPSGFFLAEDAGEMLGFHWTKVHRPNNAGQQPIGEVYVVGVAPAAQGRKLGAALTLVGLQHLRGLGLAVVKLYVEADNTPAVSLYDRLGFTRFNADTCFQRSEARH